MHVAHLETTAVAVTYLRWIPLAPLLGMLVHALFGRRLGRGAVGTIACASVAVSFAVSVYAFVDLHGLGQGVALVDSVYHWIQAGTFSIDATFSVDALSAVMCLVVTGVGLLIHVYSTGYMGHDPDYARYFCYLNLFTAAMLVLVLADNMVLMFVGWEGVGLCSYLLIGFWYTDPDKASAGKKAFVVNRVGDAGFVLGMLLLFWSLSDLGHASLRFADVNAAAPHLPPYVALGVALLLFIGATGKSAQLPLFVWLPDAMAGPTPVSALIHAATMVTAGVYMVARLNALFLAAPVAMEVVAVIGAVTALGAATVGVAQNDIKKVLAYSTISQLGYMFLGLGVGAFAAAIFHVVTHAFFKALLFLGAGSVIHALDDEHDIRRMGGLRHEMPITWSTFLVATLAITGIPGFSGFFSKDEILASAFASGHYVLWLVGLIGAAVTAFYMTRLLVLTFYGEFRGKNPKYTGAHESPPSMAFALIVLGILAAVGGFLGVPRVLGGSNALARYLAPAVGHHEFDLGTGTELGLMLASVVVVVVSMVFAWRLYQEGPAPDQRLSARWRAFYDALSHAYWVDQAYENDVVQPTVSGSRWLWRVVDVGVIDGAANGVATVTRSTADSWRRWSSGNVQHYALSLLIGVVLLIVVVATSVVG
jgi:NADH-quinone oxidoreductase subunit L